MTDHILATHPVDLYDACSEAFDGESWLEWDPETVLLELKDEVTDAAIDKICAVQAVAANANAVTRGAAAFEKAVMAFCNNICVMDIRQPPEVEEMSYAVSQIEAIVRKVHGTETEVRYVDEVPGYVAGVAKFRGWFMLPKNLAFAQDMLDSILNQTEGSRLRREHAGILDEVTAVVARTTRADARAILADRAVKALEKDDTASMLVRRIVGALLYDPTLPYRAKS